MISGDQAATNYNQSVTSTVDAGPRYIAGRSQFFKVTVFGINIGLFSGCEGLGADVAIEKREEGGTNGYVFHLPGRVTYPNIKLTRVVNSHSQNIAMLFAAMNDPGVRRTATITATQPSGPDLATWTLNDVVLVKWQGPSFSLDSAKAATESLELAHHGFGQS